MKKFTKQNGLAPETSILVLACLSWALAGSAADALYQNPVLAGDYPDPSVIRVRKDFWATATSSEWGPQFPLLHSTDLVNWEQTGSVFPHRPQWASGNFWAPEISEYRGRYFVYYVARKRGGPLAVAVASANSPTGPYTDHGPLVAQEAGSIDPVAVTDELGDRYLIWKEDGNSRHQPTVLWVQRLDENGAKLTGEPKEILRNDAPWEGAVVEGPFVVRQGEWFYLFYSGSGCCGRNCDYALGVARSHNLAGPWEKNPANPILAGNGSWKCPGHGSIVQDEQGRFWLLHHAYSARDFVFTGREGLLEEVKFSPDDWPTINDGKGPSVSAPSPFGVAQTAPRDFDESFHGATLKPGWQWPQDNEPMFSVEPGPPSRLILSPRAEAAKDLIGAILARPTTAGDYVATAVLEFADLRPGTLGGIAAIGDPENAVGLAAGNGKLLLWRREKGRAQNLMELPAPKTARLHLRLIASQGSRLQFSASPDGQTWISTGGDQPGDKLPPWDRSMRVGMTAGGAEGCAARFDSFRIVSRTGR